MVKRFRRVVTGLDQHGRSCIVFDGEAACVAEMASMPGLALTDVWETTTTPANNSGIDDAVERPVRLEPPAGGSLFRIVEFPPDSAWRDGADAGAAFASIGSHDAHDETSSDPMMHKTATIDYIVVLSGEMHAVLEAGETLLKPGDLFVQRGTVHSWSVRGTEPCIIAVVLVNATRI
ncbi:cupin domain-containing protein [Lichenicoccus sp.]|uniref:cupin domain-containing protein n=1 Tax=Lichenicoccus sp. TaxID=2781899 RepID=UPI003D1094FD